MIDGNNEKNLGCMVRSRGDERSFSGHTVRKGCIKTSYGDQVWL